MNKLISLVVALVIAIAFNLSAGMAYAKGGVIKRATISRQAKKAGLKKVAQKKRVTVQSKKEGPHLFILWADMTAADLHDELKRWGVKSIVLDACWRGDTTGVKDSLMSDSWRLWSVYKDIDGNAKHAPVIWHNFSYQPEVIEARAQDQFTKQYKDHTLACHSAGTVERWNPYACIRGNMPYHGTDGEINDDGPGCTAPDEHFPKFRAGEAIWVTDE